MFNHLIRSGRAQSISFSAPSTSTPKYVKRGRCELATIRRVCLIRGCPSLCEHLSPYCHKFTFPCVHLLFSQPHTFTHRIQPVYTKLGRLDPRALGPLEPPALGTLGPSGTGALGPTGTRDPWTLGLLSPWTLGPREIAREIALNIK